MYCLLSPPPFIHLPPCVPPLELNAVPLSTGHLGLRSARGGQDLVVWRLSSVSPARWWQWKKMFVWWKGEVSTLFALTLCFVVSIWLGKFAGEVGKLVVWMD